MREKTMVAPAAIGILLPYAVGIAGTVVLGENVGNHDFYLSGQLQASDDATTLATLIAYGLGLSACVPWFWSHWTNLSVGGRLCMGCGLALLAIVHLAAVFVVRFLYYIRGRDSVILQAARLVSALANTACPRRPFGQALGAVQRAMEQQNQSWLDAEKLRRGRRRPHQPMDESHS